MPVSGDRPRVRNLFDLIEDEDAPDPGPAEVPVWDEDDDEPPTTDYIRDLLDLWHGEHEGLVLVTDWRELPERFSMNGQGATPRELDMRPLLWRDASFSFREVFPFYPVDDDARFIRSEGRYSSDPGLDEPVGQPIERVPEDAVQEFHWPEQRDALASWLADRPAAQVRMAGQPLIPEVARRIRAVWMSRFDGRGGRIVHIVRASSSHDDEQEEEQRVGDPVVLQASKVVRELPKWLWKGRIPRGMVTLLDGDPGVGKSTLTVDIAARVTQGERFPDGARGWGPRDVVILSAEDDPHQTIVPRLEAAGADLDRVFLHQGLRDELGNPVPPEVPGELDVVERVVRENSAGLLIIDPFVAYLEGGIDSHRDQAVRKAMSALKLLAERHGVAVILVRHLTKGSGGSKALYRGGGSIGFIAHARAAMIVAPHPENREWLVLAQSKLNVGQFPDAVMFRVVPWERHPEWGRIEWGDHTDLSADDVLREPPKEPTKRDEAEEWLVDLLLDEGRVRSEELLEKAQDEGFSRSTLHRARSDLKNAGVIENGRESGDDPHWFWRLAGSDDD